MVETQKPRNLANAQKSLVNFRHHVSFASLTVQSLNKCPEKHSQLLASCEFCLIHWTFAQNSMDSWTPRIAPFNSFTIFGKLWESRNASLISNIASNFTSVVHWSLINMVQTEKAYSLHYFLLSTSTKACSPSLFATAGKSSPLWDYHLVPPAAELVQESLWNVTWMVNLHRPINSSSSSSHLHTDTH